MNSFIIRIGVLALILWNQDQIHELRTFLGFSKNHILRKTYMTWTIMKEEHHMCLSPRMEEEHLRRNIFFLKDGGRRGRS